MGLQDHEKNIFGQIWLFGSKFGAKKLFFDQIFQKKFFFQKFFIFDLSDSESKKGQKNDENFFPYYQTDLTLGHFWPKMTFSDFKEF